MSDIIGEICGNLPQKGAPFVLNGAPFAYNNKMEVYLVKRSFFTWNGQESWQLPVLEKPIAERMEEALGVTMQEELPSGACGVVFFPAFPFLPERAAERLLALHEGSFAFEGGFVLRGGSEGQLSAVCAGGLLGPAVFTFSAYAQACDEATRRQREVWLSRGVLVEAGAEIGCDVQLGEGCFVAAGARLGGDTRLGRGVAVGAGSELYDCTIGDGTQIRASVLHEATVGKHCVIGPFAHLRPFSVLGDGCKAGAFVEVKAASVGRGSKLPHLSYVGDAELGENVNVGCGVVFANYNGREKLRSRVGSGCFLGCNVNVVAPVTIGEGCFVAAGTTVTHDLAPGSFCIGRMREREKAGGAARYFPPHG